ncbi:unnamed protein product [Euphydryas editha]|uniref:FHA domain-containing protein n=1 Tax=Euphydryas editha TaxID=104508 RepID=A0AAU9U3N5_EUPED|nr:unnamed protein product [Euphydryas editha]
MPPKLMRREAVVVNEFGRSGGEAALGAAVAMRLSALTIGSDSACDVVLDARCRHVSPRHAVIFCDEVTRHFELINYSEWGSLVNGVLFACDATRAREPECAPEREPERERESEREREREPERDAPDAALRRIVRRRQGRPLRVNGSLTAGGARARECRCAEAAPAARGAREGSALLPHGALLQFGCRLYVFSITDRDSFPHLPALDEPEP